MPLARPDSLYSDLIVAVDHKPLLKILGDRSLDVITNTFLRNLKDKSLRYRFRMVYISGIHNKVSVLFPDTSRATPTHKYSTCLTTSHTLNTLWPSNACS